MTTSDPTAGPGGPGGGREPTEEEMRAALEAELDRISVGDVLIQTLVTLVNLAGRRLGLAPGGQAPPDLEQARDAIEGVRVLLPLVEARQGDAVKPIRDALTQLQMAYAQMAGAAGAAGAAQGEAAREAAGAAEGAGAAAPPGGEGRGAPPSSGPPPSQPAPGQPGAEDAGPAQRSGRLWIPGQ